MSEAKDEGTESLNLPPVPSVLQIPESSDENQAEKQKTTSEFVSSLNNLVKKELRDLTQSLPSGNLGRFKLLDGSGDDIIGPELDPQTKRPHKKRGPPVNKEPFEGQQPKKSRKKRVPGLQRKTWDQRAACVFAYLHPRIGHKDYHLTAELCKVSSNTLRGWTSKALLIAKWVAFLDTMTAKEAADILDLDLAKLGVEPTDKIDALCIGDFKNILARKNMVPVIIKKSKKRVQSRPRVSKWHPQFIFVRKILDLHWENGKPVSLKIIRDLVQTEFQAKQQIPTDIPGLPSSLTADETIEGVGETERKKPEKKTASELFSKRYLSPDGKNFPTLVNTFITRAINRSGYLLEDGYLKRLLPFDWKEDFELFSKAVIEQAKALDIDSIVVLSEVFMATSYNTDILTSETHAEESTGFVTLQAVEIPSNKLLKPLIVKTGAVENSIQNDLGIYATNEDGNIEVNHVALYLKELSKQLEGKKSLVLLNESSKHKADEINIAVAESNGTITLKYIPNALDSIVNIISGHLVKEFDQILKTKLDFDYHHNATGFKKPQLDLEENTKLLNKFYDYVKSSEDFSEMIEKCFVKTGIHPFVPEERLKVEMENNIKVITEVQQVYMKLEKSVPPSVPKPDSNTMLQLNLP